MQHKELEVQLRDGHTDVGDSGLYYEDNVLRINLYVEGDEPLIVELCHVHENAIEAASHRVAFIDVDAVVPLRTAS